MTRQLKPGQTFEYLEVTNIHEKKVAIPDKGGSPIHLQFRRYARCPVCNLHLQSFVRRHSDLEATGIKEVVIFHSSDEELLKYQSNFPFDVVGDPGKTLYRKYGVESSITSIFNPKAWPAMIAGLLSKDRPDISLAPNGGVLGLPADILICPDGKIEAVHYGAHADDQWSVDHVIKLASMVSSRR
jgi:peroxiredoxin